MWSVYNKLNDTLNDNDFAFKGSKYDVPIEKYAKGYIKDLKDGKPDPLWPSSRGPKPTDPDYQHKELLKRLGFNPEDYADDQMQPQILDCKSLLYTQTTMVAVWLHLWLQCKLNIISD